MSASDLRRCYSAIFPFWDKISEEDKELLCLHTVERSYPSGANLHGGDGECTGAIVVKSGCVRVFMLSEEGREITLYRLYKDDVCMLSASCVLKSVTFDVMADADSDCRCLIISGKTFSEVTDRNIYAMNFALETAVARFSDVMWVMQQILFMSLDKRLAVFLTDELARTGGDTVRLSNDRIAKYMGSAREAVSRMLKYFASEGIAKRTPEGVRVLSRERLRALTL